MRGILVEASERGLGLCDSFLLLWVDVVMGVVLFLNNTPSMYALLILIVFVC